MKKLLILTSFLVSIQSINAQIVINLKKGDSIVLKEKYKDFSDVFDMSDLSYDRAAKKYTDDLYFIATSESISSDEEFTFFHEYYVLKDGTVKLCKFSLEGKALKMTKEQEERIEKNFAAYIKYNNFGVTAKENWHEFGFTKMPKLEKKRFYRDYINPTPQPTASEDTKLGIIQRLGNYCTDKWFRDGTRNPMELKLKGLINISLYTLDEDNALFAKLKKKCPNESVDSLVGQVFDYMASTPIYKAYLGFFEPHPDYLKYMSKSCDCMEKQILQLGNQSSRNISLALDTCRGKIFTNAAFIEYTSQTRTSIAEQAEKNNIGTEVADNIYESGFTGYMVLNCPLIHKIWRSEFISSIQKDSMEDLEWSVKRKDLSATPISELLENHIDTLNSMFRSRADYLKNLDELKLIATELRKIKNFAPGLVGQRKTKEEYIEEIVIFDKGIPEPPFEIKIHYDKTGDVDKLTRVEYVPKSKVNLNGRNNRKNKKQ